MHEELIKQPSANFIMCQQPIRRSAATKTECMAAINYVLAILEDLFLQKGTSMYEVIEESRQNKLNWCVERTPLYEPVIFFVCKRS